MAVIDNVRAVRRDHRYEIVVQLIVWECPTCGIIYGIPESFADECRRNGDHYFCPNGHRLSWRETEADRQRKRADRAEQRARWAGEERDAARQLADTERRRAAAYKGHLTRIRKRIANGVCPVPGCKRSGFAQVLRHIASQHPDWLHDHPEATDG